MSATRALAWLVLPAALAVAAVGFFWLAGASLPYQDPTPAQLSQQDTETRQALWLMLAGSALAIADGVGLWRTRGRPT